MRKVCFVLMAVCIGLPLFALVAPEAQAASIKLTYSNFFPASPHSESVGRFLVQGG